MKYKRLQLFLELLDFKPFSSRLATIIIKAGNSYLYIISCNAPPDCLSEFVEKETFYRQLDIVLNDVVNMDDANCRLVPNASNSYANATGCLLVSVKTTSPL